MPVIFNAFSARARVDWTLNTKHSIYGRYLQDNYDQPAPFSPTNYLYTTTLGVSQRPQTFVVGDTYSIKTNILNSFHFTFGGNRALLEFQWNRPRRKVGVQNIFTPPLATDNLRLRLLPAASALEEAAFRSGE